jgi:hypothetical protein
MSQGAHKAVLSASAGKKAASASADRAEPVRERTALSKHPVGKS